MNKRCIVFLGFLALIMCAKATQTMRPSVGQGPLQSLRLQVLSNTAHLRTLGDDCDGLHWCDSNFVCKDYRCAPKGTTDNQVAWSP